MPTDGEDAFREVYDDREGYPGDNSAHPGFANDDTRPTYVIAAPGSGTARPSLGLGGGSRLTGLLVLGRALKNAICYGRYGVWTTQL